MTSRPSAGTQRQAQRSLSGASLIQRPVSHRVSSQQHQSSSSLVRKSENYVDLTLEGTDTVSSRNGGNSRIGGSRLKLEVSNDTYKGATGANKSPKPTSDTHSDISPRGRPTLHFDNNDTQAFRGTGSEAHLLSSFQGSDNVTGQAPLPMPRRPGQYMLHLGRAQKAFPTHIPIKKDTRPKPYTLETPAIAPNYPPNGHADFFPWTGNHPEDQFTDHVIRQGFFDKTQTTQNETGSAKLSIFPVLKHKSGLQTLSSLFTTVLAQRRTHGQIISSPTFKPPPRVTLTDTKRETWLRDLANPTISLRRLSRTIPHGIRGKVLLEQCLSKRIPTERAIWLAKCVGANEIRAFKRKGVTGTFAMGGEAKWIRDWTAFVEQFVESMVNVCGEKDWKDRILYAVRLAVHLYSEHLLDREHYMDWLSSSLESCPLAKAPIWLLVAQVYWRDLLAYRKHGRRLVAALCAHLQAAHDTPDRDLLEPLIDRITMLLKDFMETYPESWISPKMWNKYRNTIETYLTRNGHSLSSAFIAIDKRNKQLVTSRGDHNTSSHGQIINLLDTTLLCPFSSAIAKECWNITTDISLLIRTVLQWATSYHRPGLAKVYIGARILRLWSKYEFDLHHEILIFLGSEFQYSGLNKSNLYHLVSELTRSGHFLTSKYIQWLIARGGVRGPADLAKDGPASTRLLAELPLSDVSANIESLRRTLLGRAHLSVGDEIEEVEAQIQKIKAVILKVGDGTVPDSFDQQGAIPVGSFAKRPDLSRAVKSEIGSWLRSLVSSYVAHQLQTSCKFEPFSEIPTRLTSGCFKYIRNILEEIDDISMLADVLHLVINLDDIQILASTADTLALNHDSFAAIGALQGLFDKLLARMRSFVDMRDTDTTSLLKALHCLAARIPGAESTALQLSQELIRSYRRTAADACSPVSDYMTEVLQNHESDFSDEIDKMLASGTSMDHSTLGRIFHMLIDRSVASWDKDTQQQHNSALLLVQLRTFGVKQFESLMSTWLVQTMETSTRPSLVFVLGSLISVGCIVFDEVLNHGATILEGHERMSNSSSAKIALELLALLIGTPEDAYNMTTEDAYRLAIMRLHVQQDSPAEALAVVRRAIALTAPSTPDMLKTLITICHSQQAYKFMQTVVLTHLDLVEQTLIAPLVKESRQDVNTVLSELTQALLYAEPPSRPSALYNSQTLSGRIESALQSVDDLTLPFCQIELQVLFGTAQSTNTQEGKDDLRYIDAFDMAVDSILASKNRAWTSIIRSLDVQITRHLCQKVENFFLSLLPSGKTDDQDILNRDCSDLARRLLFVLEATICSLQSTMSQVLASQVVDRLNDIWQIASQGDTFPQKEAVDIWIPLLLDFITLHLNNSDSSKSGSEVRARMLLSLSALILELQIPANNETTVVQRIFDVTIVLVDDLPEDARLNCARALKEKAMDPRIRYIFGYSVHPMDWLQLSHKGKMMPYSLRRWEILSEPTPNVGENDTSLSLTLFQARKM